MLSLHKVSFLWLGSFLLLVSSACSRSEPCLQVLPEEIVRKQNALATANEEAKLKVLNEKRAVLNVAPLEGGVILSNEDPFSTSVATDLSPQSPNQYLIFGKYLVFHGWTGAQTFYETEPSAQRYFIVDEVLLGTTNQSLHSWHASPDNGLIRAVFKPNIEIIDKISVCGCGPNATESVGHHVESSGAASVAPLPDAIFVLPGDKAPTLLNQNFEIEYEERRIEIKYVPQNGKVCRPDQVAC